MTKRLAGDEAGILEAIATLKAGKLVAIPTETVYGLGARADDPVAVRSIFAAKERPDNHPLIVHVGDIAQFHEWASELPEAVIKLAQAFCPGPLTFILPMRPGLDRTVTGGQDWVGLRIPAHPLTLRILQESRLGIAAPSANRFGRISPTCVEDVLQELKGRIDAVIDGGTCQVGIESTIIKIEKDRIVVLRPGHIRPEAIEAVANCPVEMPDDSDIRVSGKLESHYAPLKPAYRIERQQLESVTHEWGRTDWVISYEPLPEKYLEHGVRSEQLQHEPEAYAQQFYAALRRGDAQPGIERIWIIEPEDRPEWAAVRDRLKRATHTITC